MKMIVKFGLIYCSVLSVRCGFLHGIHHHFPPSANLISSRTIFSSAVGGGPTSGAYSTAQYSQTVSTPTESHSLVSTHHPVNYGQHSQRDHSSPASRNLEYQRESDRNSPTDHGRYNHGSSQNRRGDSYNAYSNHESLNSNYQGQYLQDHHQAPTHKGSYQAYNNSRHNQDFSEHRQSQRTSHVSHESSSCNRQQDHRDHRYGHQNQNQAYNQDYSGYRYDQAYEGQGYGENASYDVRRSGSRGSSRQHGSHSRGYLHLNDQHDDAN